MWVLPCLISLLFIILASTSLIQDQQTLLLLPPTLYTLLDPTNFSYIRLLWGPFVKESGTLARLSMSVKSFKLFCLYFRPFMIWPHTFSPLSSSRLLPHLLLSDCIFYFSRHNTLTHLSFSPWDMLLLLECHSKLQHGFLFVCLFPSPRIKFTGPSCSLSLIPNVH